ncbi:MAG TPA: S-layer homology domain-containing protein [Pseudobacteroides sp.]|nr:S-layer homology domain-containing protein [Pseudobacteroides sp.]
MRKRLLSLLVIVFMMLNTLIAYGEGANSVMTLEIGPVTEVSGDIVSVPIKVKNVPSIGIYSFSASINFDTDSVSVKNITNGELIPQKYDFDSNYSNEDGWLVLFFAAPSKNQRIISKDGIIATLELSTKYENEVLRKLEYDTERSGFNAVDDTIINVEVSVAGPGNALTPINTLTPTNIPTHVNTNTPTTTTAINTPAVVSTHTTETNTPMVTPKPTPTEAEEVKTTYRVPVAWQFADIKAHWTEKYALELYKRYIVDGYPDGTMRPNLEITRIEMAVLIVKAKGLKIDESTVLSFKDNSSIPDWGLKYLKTAVKEKIIQGFDDGTVKPFKQLTRQEAVTMIARAWNLGEDTVSEADLADYYALQNWAKGYIARAFKLGIISGYEDKTFRPTQNITRAEIFKLVSSTMEYIEK